MTEALQSINFQLYGAGLPASLRSLGVRKYDDEIGRFTSIDPLCFPSHAMTPVIV